MDGNGTFSEKQVISNTVDGATSVYASDLDGDQDIDVLSASPSDDTIAWYENEDGNGTFSEKQVITSTVRDASFVSAADLDGDQDMDVLSASRNDDVIAWYENENVFRLHCPRGFTLQTNGRRCQPCRPVALCQMEICTTHANRCMMCEPHHTIAHGGLCETIKFEPNRLVSRVVLTRTADGASSVYAADLDGDNDMDVLSSSIYDDTVAWHENVDGNGTFSEKQVITSTADGAYSVYAADLDGDGDMDVLSASEYDDTVAWYENMDGHGIFSEKQVITSTADGTHSVYAADLDGDHDMDVLSASYLGATVAWYENMDGNGAFSDKKIITSRAFGANSVYAADLDGDNDMDVLSASRFDNTIAWYKNIDGNGAFSEKQVISGRAHNPSSVYAADLDGDNDVDVLSASFRDDTIAWYENVDGNGAFSEMQVITKTAVWARSVSSHTCVQSPWVSSSQQWLPHQTVLSTAH